MTVSLIHCQWKSGCFSVLLVIPMMKMYKTLSFPEVLWKHFLTWKIIIKKPQNTWPKKSTPEEIRNILEASSSTEWNQSKEFHRSRNVPKQALVPNIIRGHSAVLGDGWLGFGRSHYSTGAREDRLRVGVVKDIGSRLDFISLPSSLRDP